MISGRLDRLADGREIDLFRLVFDIGGVGLETCPGRDDARHHLQRELDAHQARAAVHVLDRHAQGGGSDRVADRSDRAQNVGNLCSPRIVVDSRNLGARIDTRRDHSGDRCSGFLDCRRTMGTGHAADAELNVLLLDGLLCRSIRAARANFRHYCAHVVLPHVGSEAVGDIELTGACSAAVPCP